VIHARRIVPSIRSDSRSSGYRIISARNINDTPATIIRKRMFRKKRSIFLISIVGQEFLTSGSCEKRAEVEAEKI
jgi:hypothetical protein